MTRINLVKVEDLADQHLFAEWREIKMVPASLRRSLKTRSVKDILAGIPKNYTLNKGHVTFFFNKMLFLYDRYMALTDELDTRGYALAQHDPNFIFFRDIPDIFKTVEWCPTKDDIKVSIDRIVIRLNEKPLWYKYHGHNQLPLFFEKKFNALLDN